MNIDVIPLSLGIEIDNDLRMVFVRRNSTVARKENLTKVGIMKVSEFGPVLYDCDRQILKIRILEGERKLASKNCELAILELVGVKKETQIRITFNINIELEISVKAEDVGFSVGSRKKEVGVTVKTIGRLKIEEVNNIITESDGTFIFIPPSNVEEQNRVIERERLQHSLIRTLNLVKLVGLEIVGELEKSKYEKIVKDMLLWLETGNHQEKKEVLAEKRKELEEVVVKYYREVLGDQFQKYFDSQAHPDILKMDPSFDDLDID